MLKEKSLASSGSTGIERAIEMDGNIAECRRLRNGFTLVLMTGSISLDSRLFEIWKEKLHFTVKIDMKICKFIDFLNK